MTDALDDAAPACPGPDPAPHGPTRFAMPAGAVCTHAHVIGAPPDHPLVAARSYTPPPAPAAAYLAMLDACGLANGVLVQVSVHGTDNRLLLETLRANRPRLRGIAVIAPDLVEHDLAERDLHAMRDSGIVGLRLNIEFGGGIGFDALDRYAAICRDLGWHLQILADARKLGPLAPRLARLRVPLVIDHMGLFPAAEGLDSPGARTVLSLLRDGAWVKLSGAYRLADDPPYAATVPLARALFAAAPERCLWGSDWPHVANRRAMPNVGDLLDLLADWLPDAAARSRVLVDNPRRLYGFGEIASQ